MGNPLRIPEVVLEARGSDGKQHTMIRPLICSALLLCVISAWSGDDRPDDRTALRGLMDRLTTALNSKRWADAAALVEPGASMIFVDQTVVAGPEGIGPYFEKWFGPEGDLVEVRFTPKPDRPAVFISNDIAVATGHSEDVYVMKDGREGTMPSTWTAVAVRRDGQWRVASLHCGVNVTDNIILRAQRRILGQIAWGAGIGCTIIGLGLGFLIGRRRRSVA